MSFAKQNFRLIASKFSPFNLRLINLSTQKKYVYKKDKCFFLGEKNKYISKQFRREVFQIQNFLKLKNKNIK